MGDLTTDLDHLYALAEGALRLAFHWHTKTSLEYDHTLEPADAAYIAALSPDVVKGLIERVRRAELALEWLAQNGMNRADADFARRQLEAKDE